MPEGILIAFITVVGSVFASTLAAIITFRVKREELQRKAEDAINAAEIADKAAFRADQRTLYEGLLVRLNECEKKCAECERRDLEGQQKLMISDLKIAELETRLYALEDKNGR